MPYIAIKAFPKDAKIKEEVVDKINQIFMEKWGCAPEAISISMEEVAPADWNEKVQKTEIDTNIDKMMVLAGKKRY